MKDVASPQAATTTRADPAPHPGVDERPSPPMATRRDPSGPSLLERLDRASLAERWHATAQDATTPLPGRAALQRRLGASLTGVRVRTGPLTRSLLDHLGARGATVGRTVLLRDPGDAETATHEAVHALQAQADAGACGLAPLPADDPAEREAEAIARGLPVSRIRARIRPGRVALRRSVLPTRDPEVATLPPPVAAELPPLRSTEHDEDAVDSRPPRRRSTDDADGAVGTADATPTAAQPTGDEPTVDEPVAEPSESEASSVSEAASTPAAGEQTSAEGERAPRTREPATAPAAPPTEAGPNRRDEVAKALEALQTTWDAGAKTADDHTVEGCPTQARTADEHPFARGPPLDTPDTRDDDVPDDPEPAMPDRSALDGARRQVRERLSQAPARAPPTDTSGLDADQQRERDEQRRRVDRHIRDATADERLDVPDVPSVARDGVADPARADEARTAYDGRAAVAAADAAQLAEEDFGEGQVAPVDDPTIGHDLALDELDVPVVDVATRIGAARVDQIATDDNAGQLPLDDVRVVRDHELAAVEEDAALQDALGARIDEQTAASDSEVDRLCGVATRQRDTLDARARDGVDQRRGAWTGRTEAHVTERTTQAGQLQRDKVAHARTIEQDANAKAKATVEAAEADAAGQWDEVRDRADAKAAASEDKSWFDRGIDWVRDKIASLVAWIDDFIEACRRAINALLDAASALAHRIIDAGRDAIAATFDGLRAGLDLIADNLPGELGEIAREHRDDVHEFLDDVQADVDGWAEQLHAQVDERVADVRGRLDETLDTLQQGVHDVADTIDDFLEHGLMALLRSEFSLVAALIDDGLSAPVRRAADTLESWIGTALDLLGLTALEQTLTGWQDEEFCAAATSEEQAETCAAFQSMLGGLMAKVDELLASPIAQQIQAFFQERRDAEAARQVDAVEGFFSFLEAVARPVYEWWQQIQPVVERVLETMGDIASTVWRHIAIALGIDPDLTPLEALQQGLEALWDAVTDAVAPLVERLREAWVWLRDQTVLASVLAFLATLPQLWDGLARLWNVVSQGAMDWLARAADLLATTVLPVVDAVLGAVSRVVHAVIDVVDQWTDALLGALDALLSWEPAIALVAAIAAVLSALTAPLRLALQAARDCLLRAWRSMADLVAELTDHVRTFLDIVVGLSIALLTFPIGMVAFFAGNIWLRVLPACYKPPIINFLLDLAIRFLRFLPEPADIMFAILYNGALGWFQGLRGSDDAKKVAAIDLLASIFAGNAEVAAGFVVGLAEGVWESTGGTLIFLLQAAGWLLTLPVKLVRWAASTATDGPTPAEPGAEAPTGAGSPSAAGAGRPRARAPPSTAPAQATALEVERPAEDEAAAADDDIATQTPTTGPTPPDEPSDAELDRALDRAPQSGAPADDDREMPPHLVDEIAPTHSPDLDETPEEPPAAPSALSDLSGMLEQLVAGGFTRQDIVRAIDASRAAAASMVRTLAQKTAGVLLDALGAAGAAFTIGRTLGTIVGELVVEVLLAVFTGGASAGVTAAKVALSGARLTARFAGVIRKLRHALEPLLDMVRTMREAFGGILNRLRRWFDDVLEWMRGVLRRRRRPSGSPTRRATPTREKPRRTADRSSDAQERNRRLRAAIRAMRPRLQRMFRRRVRRVLLRARLAYWKVRYRLRKLSAERTGRHAYRIVAGNSADQTVVRGVSPTDSPLLRLIREEVDEYFDARVPEVARALPFAGAQGTRQRPFDLRTTGAGTLPAWEAAQRHRFLGNVVKFRRKNRKNPMVEEVKLPMAQEWFIVGSRRTHAGNLVPILTRRSGSWGGLMTQGNVQLVLNNKVTNIGSHENIGKMFRDLVMDRAVDPADLSDEIDALVRTGRVSQAAAPFQQQVGMYAGTLGEEAGRERAASLFARAPHVQMRDVPVSEAAGIPALFEGPHAPKGATAVARGVRHEIGVKQTPTMMPNKEGRDAFLPGGKPEERADYVRKETAAYRVLGMLTADPKVAPDLAAFRVVIRNTLSTLYG